MRLDFEYHWKKRVDVVNQVTCPKNMLDKKN